jgi:photosystem II stability/assembly factor-like uncharacterized protein
MARRRRLLALAPLALALAPAAHAGPVPPLDAAAFVSVRVGWVGGAGTILATRDGGRSWTRQWRGAQQVTDLSATDGRHAWALVAGRLLRTVDGRTWAFAGGPRLEHVDFGAGLGLGVTPDRRLLRSNDGGRSWHTLRFRGDAICFAGPRRGWAVSGRDVFATADGGGLWGRVYRLPLPGEGSPWAVQLVCANGVAWAFWAQAIGMSQAAQVLVRGDASGWRAVLAEGMVAQAFHGLWGTTDADPGPLVLGGGAVRLGGTCTACGEGTMSVTRGNAGWRRSNLPLPGLGPFALAFPDRLHGYAAVTSGGHGYVLATADGGRTWSRVLASPGLTELTVRERPHGDQGPASTYTLRCAPTGGTHPYAAQACAELAASPGALEPVTTPCTRLPIRGAPDAFVRGTYRGKPVNRLFRPACDSALWARLRLLLAGR